MSCHRIGLGMNSVVEKSIEMFENEDEAIACIKSIEFVLIEIGMML